MSGQIASPSCRATTPAALNEADSGQPMADQTAPPEGPTGMPGRQRTPMLVTYRGVSKFAGDVSDDVTIVAVRR